MAGDQLRSTSDEDDSVLQREIGFICQDFAGNKKNIFTQVQVGDALKENLQTHTPYEEASIIARAVCPDSERSTYAWPCNDSRLGELLDFDFKKPSLGKLYQIGDKLVPQKEAMDFYAATAIEWKAINIVARQKPKSNQKKFTELWEYCLKF